MRAIYPGSFDPITLGHLDVLKRASKLFSHVTLLVAQNGQKQEFIPFHVRVKLVEWTLNHLRGDSGDFKNIEIMHVGDMLTVDVAKKLGAGVIIRGLRAVTDYESEHVMSQANAMLDPNIETVFLVTSPEYSFISSSMVREIARLNGDVSKLVSQPILDYLRDRFK